MSIKLIALDVDGTLLDDNHRISANNRDTIRRAAEQGVSIVLCTGRGSMSAKPVMDELGLEGVMITHNGASIMDTKGNVLHEFTFSVREVVDLIHYCRERGIHYDLNTSGNMIIDQLPADAAKMYEAYLAEPEMVHDVLKVNEPLVKFCMFGSQAMMDQVERDWPDDQHELKFIRSGDYFVDVMRPDVSKGIALKKLAEIWQVDRSEILAMGNYFNDIDMLRFAGIGIAVANSPDEVKQAADEVTVSNNEEAVHVALCKHLPLIGV
jgi:hypothetical protein